MSTKLHKFRRLAQAERKVEARVENYSWGTLRTVRQGNAFTVVLHPPHWEQIERLQDGQSVCVRTEDGTTWEVEMDSESLRFRSGSMRVAVAIEELQD